ncbi:hypothetical protein BT63DRAFT_457362 [Microthyrium microscopicum]|uniref:Uncharacterized protein n=1 Tax=Microthyrium microscopicum TaxID=703497 RepID=A0A6A6U7E3_9PEZI|nr:hypothetical protein BT63DRAFT_457362 [Microthyrium microscopicum]
MLNLFLLFPATERYKYVCKQPHNENLATIAYSSGKIRMMIYEAYFRVCRDDLSKQDDVGLCALRPESYGQLIEQAKKLFVTCKTIRQESEGLFDRIIKEPNWTIEVHSSDYYTFVLEFAKVLGFADVPPKFWPMVKGSLDLTMPDVPKQHIIRDIGDLLTKELIGVIWSCGHLSILEEMTTPETSRWINDTERSCVIRKDGCKQVEVYYSFGEHYWRLHEYGDNPADNLEEEDCLMLRMSGDIGMLDCLSDILTCYQYINGEARWTPKTYSTKELYIHDMDPDYNRPNPELV